MLVLEASQKCIRFSSIWRRCRPRGNSVVEHSLIMCFVVWGLSYSLFGWSLTPSRVHMPHTRYDQCDCDLAAPSRSGNTVDIHYKVNSFCVVHYKLCIATSWFCVLLPAAGQQSKTATQASVKTPSTTVTSSSTSTPGKPGTPTSTPAATTAKSQEPAKKKLEKVDLNAVSSALLSVFADFEQVVYICVTHVD